MRYIIPVLVLFLYLVMVVSTNISFAQTGNFSKTALNMTIQKGYSSGVGNICISPDGKFILSSDFRGNQIFLFSSDLMLIRQFDGYEHGLAFHPHGDKFLFGTKDNTIIVMDLYGKKLKTLSNSNEPIKDIAVSKSGMLGVTIRDKRTALILFDRSGKKRIKINTKPYSLHTPPVFTPNGQYIAAGTSRGKVIFWDLEGKVKRIINAYDDKVKKPYSSYEVIVHKIAFSRDGRFMATASPEKRIILWNAKSGIQLPTSGDMSKQEVTRWDSLRSFGFRPDGQFPDGNKIIKRGPGLAISSYDTNGNLLNTFTGRESFRATVIPISNNRLLTSNYHDKIRIWGADGEVETLFADDTIGMENVAVSPKERYIAGTPKEKGKILFWDLEGNYKGCIRIGNTKRVGSIAFSPSGKTIAATLWDNSVCIWTLSGKLLFKSNKLAERGSAIAFSSDGKYLVAGTAFGSNLMIVELSTKTIKIIPGVGGIGDISFSPDGKYFITGGTDGKIESTIGIGVESILWEFSGRKITTFPNNENTYATAFSPDGRFIVSGGGINQLKFGI